jgi:hypothetical protein
MTCEIRVYEIILKQILVNSNVKSCDWIKLTKDNLITGFYQDGNEVSGLVVST